MTNRKAITVDDLWHIERLGAPALSPDGAQAVCTLASYSMEDNKACSSLWLLSTFGGGPRRLTVGGEKDGQAAWSPRGDRIAFVAKREQQGHKDETPQLYLIAPDGGEARRVSDFAPGIEAFKWFPDGKRIAFVAWVWPELNGARAQVKRHKEFQARKETGYATSETVYRYWDHNLPMERVPHLHVLDIETGRVTDLFEGSSLELTRSEPNASTFDISPDGRRIAFAQDPNPVKRFDNFGVITELTLRSGAVQTIAADKAWDFDAPRYAPDGRRIAFLASHRGVRHTMPAQPALVEHGKRWKPVARDWDRSVNAPLRWSAAGDALYFTAEERGRCHLWRLALGGAAPTIVAPGGWVQGFDVAGDTVVTVADAMDHPARATAYRSEAPPRRLEQFNDALLARLKFGTHEDITVKGALGEPVQMWVVYPPGFDKRKKYPLLHSIHGGPHAASGDTFHYRWNNQVFAAQGYVVACVNYHGSSGFGFAFTDSITHRWGELELQDVEAGTDWLLEQPWADRRHVFATGGSYGGFMVAWMNGHVKPGRYCAYVCHAGCFDWTAMYAGDAYTWFKKELGAWFWDDIDRVHRQSPHAFAQHMRTPTLVVHGALDYRVPDAQGLAYYNTLKAREVDARLLWFPDENHWILKPRNSRQWYAEYFGWLKRHGDRARPPR